MIYYIDHSSFGFPDFLFNRTELFIYTVISYFYKTKNIVKYDTKYIWYRLPTFILSGQKCITKSETTDRHLCGQIAPKNLKVVEDNKYLFLIISPTPFHGLIRRSQIRGKKRHSLLIYKLEITPNVHLVKENEYFSLSNFVHIVNSIAEKSKMCQQSRGQGDCLLTN